MEGGLLTWVEDYLKHTEIRKVIKAQKSKRCRVKSGLSEESVLLPIMFLVYVNATVEGENCYTSLSR